MKSKEKIVEILEAMEEQEDDFANGVRHALEWFIGRIYNDEFEFYVEED